MSNRLTVSILVAFAALALAGCNSGGAPADLSANARNVAPGDLELPEGAGCSGAIARYGAIVGNDLSMGHVDPGVHDQIQRELRAAGEACSAGRDAQAMSLLRASKARHGYP